MKKARIEMVRPRFLNQLEWFALYGVAKYCIRYSNEYCLSTVNGVIVCWVDDRTLLTISKELKRLGIDVTYRLVE